MSGSTALTQDKAERSDMSSPHAEHVRQMPLESGQKLGYVRFFWEVWFVDRFQCFALHQLTQCIPLIVRSF
jgi:hypothetical protein